MPEDQVPQQSKPAEQPRTENQAAQPEPSEISSLGRYMARQKAQSSAPEAKQAQTGEGSPQSPAAPRQDNREQFIPRSRFDEVLNERNQLREQVQQPQQQAPQPAQQQWQQPQGIQTGMQAFQPQQAQPQQAGPTGMQGFQPQQQQQNTPNFDDPAVQKEWQRKIANNPVTGLREFVELLITSRGTPLLEQFRQQISNQLTPIQQTFVQQQLSSYTSQRQQQDPSFTQVAPAFNQLVQQAQQRGYTLTPQVLQAIEGIARAQSGMLTQAQAPQQQPPFSEAPGGTGSFGQSNDGPNLTPQEQTMAERFGMTAEEYAAARRTYG